MSYRVTTTALICLVMFSVAIQNPGVPVASREEEIDTATAAEAICGPRSAKKILSEFGIEEKLHRLVEEIQPSQTKRGSCMSVLDEALRKRGIFTAPMHVGSNVRIDWAYPVLLHLKRNGFAADHFAVQLPSANKDSARVWMGPGDVQTVSWQSAAMHRSGAVLLTSAEPIRDPGLAFHFGYARWNSVGLLVGFLVLSSAGVLFWFKIRERKKPCVT